MTSIAGGLATMARSSRLRAVSRISARDLARIGRMLLGGGTINGVRILSPQSVETMLAAAWRFDGRNGSRGGSFG